MKKTFVFYNDWQDYTEEMTLEEKWLFLQAILDYQNWKELGDLWIIKFVRSRVKKQLDQDNSKRSEEVEKRRESWRLWGLAKQSNTKQVLASASKWKQLLADNVNDNVYNNINNTENIKSKQDLLELYTVDELTATEQIKAKYTFVYEFVEWGYNKIPKSKKWIDDFTNKIAEKCIHAIGKIDRNHIRATLRKIKDREEDNKKKTSNYMSRFNTFLLPKK